MRFRTIAEVEAFTNLKFKEFGIDIPALFIPTSATTSVDRADCGSDSMLRLAKRRKAVPETLAEEFLSYLNDPRFSTARGFLNFYGDDDREWLFTEDPISDSEAVHDPLVVGIVAPDLPPGIQLSRVKSQALFHAYLYLKIYPTAYIIFGDRELAVTKKNFLEIAREFLLAENASVDASAEALHRKGLFLHVSPKGLPRPLYKKIISSQRSRRKSTDASDAQEEIRFKTLERVSLSTGSVLWPETWLNSVCDNPNKLLSMLWYLSLPLRGSELDPTVVGNQENANPLWWIHKIVVKSRSLSIPDFFSVPGDVPSPADRYLVLAMKFFNRRLLHAVQSGEIEPFLLHVQQLLSYQERQLNHPTVRQQIKDGSLTPMQRFILPGIVARLELFFD